MLHNDLLALLIVLALLAVAATPARAAAMVVPRVVVAQAARGNDHRLRQVEKC